MDAKPNVYAAPRSEAPPRRRTAEEAQFITLGIHAAIMAAAYWLKVPIWVFPLLLLADYYIRTPLAVGGQTRIPVRPAYEPFEPRQHEHGADIAEYLGRVGSALQTQGFHLVAQPLASMATSGHATSCIAVYENERGERIQVGVVYYRALPGGPLNSTGTIIIRTLFADGTEFVTANGDGARMFPIVNNNDGETFPMVRDPVQLCRIHRLLLASKARPPIARFPSQDVAQWLADEHEDHLRKVAEEGYFWKSEGGDVWLKTSKGAFLMTWRLMWPMGSLQLWMVRRRAQRLLRTMELLSVQPEASVNLQMPRAVSGFPSQLFGYIAMATALYAFFNAPQFQHPRPRPVLERLQRDRQRP